MNYVSNDYTLIAYSDITDQSPNNCLGNRQATSTCSLINVDPHLGRYFDE